MPTVSDASAAFSFAARSAITLRHSSSLLPFGRAIMTAVILSRPAPLPFGEAIVHEILTDFIVFKSFCNPVPHELDDVRARTAIENPYQKPC